VFTITERDRQLALGVAMTETAEELIRWYYGLAEPERIKLCAKNDPKYLRALEALRGKSKH